MMTLLIVLLIVGAGIFAYFQLINLADIVAKTVRWPIAYVPENESSIVTEGQDALLLLHNVDRYTAIYREIGGDKTDWQMFETTPARDPRNPTAAPPPIDIPPDTIEFEKRKWRGFFFVGILPDQQILSLTIDAARWVEDPSQSSQPFRNLITHEQKQIWSLRQNPERRLVLPDLEIGDGKGTGVHIALELILDMQHPLYAAFNRQGQFYPIIDSVTEEVMSQKVLAMKTEDFLTTPKPKLFNFDQIRDELNANAGIIESGYGVLKVIFKGFQPNENFKQYQQSLLDLAKAVQQKQIAILQAQGKKEEAKLVGEGRGEGFAAFLNAAKAAAPNATHDELVRAWQTVTSTEAASSKDSKLNTFIPPGAVGSLWGRK
jgi:hypothetical protein